LNQIETDSGIPLDSNKIRKALVLGTFILPLITGLTIFVLTKTQ
jgi:hypothetical protein